MAGAVQFWLSYDNDRERLRLPVNPESIKQVLPYGYNDVAVSQLGEVTIFGDEGLAEFSFSSFWPRYHNRSYCEYEDFKDRWLFVETIQRWREMKKPIRLIVTGTRINMAVTIRDFELDVERAGHIGDIYYSISFKEYRFIDLRIESTVNPGKTAAKTPAAKRPAAAKPATTNKSRTYTVKSGDSLSRIAANKSIYGDASKWRKIYDANKKTIGANPNNLTAGMKLVIPA